jgi:hypothetical protein
MKTKGAPSLEDQEPVMIPYHGAHKLPYRKMITHLVGESVSTAK